MLDLIYLITSNITTKAIQQVLGISRKTISRYKKLLKRMMERKFDEANWKIGGENVIVEIDESLFGKRKNHKGRIVEGVWVLGLVERTQARKIVLIKIAKRDKLTLSDIICKFVEPNSIIYTDMWRGYAGLESHSFTHCTVNHSTNFVDPMTGVHTQTIEANWSGLKQTIPKKYRNAKHVSFYLLLFMFRRNWGTDFYLNLLNAF